MRPPDQAPEGQFIRRRDDALKAFEAQRLIIGHVVFRVCFQIDRYMLCGSFFQQLVQQGFAVAASLRLGVHRQAPQVVMLLSLHPARVRFADRFLAGLRAVKIAQAQHQRGFPIAAAYKHTYRQVGMFRRKGKSDSLEVLGGLYIAVFEGDLNRVADVPAGFPAALLRVGEISRKHRVTVKRGCGGFSRRVKLTELQWRNRQHWSVEPYAAPKFENIKKVCPGQRQLVGCLWGARWPAGPADLNLDS